MSVVKEKELTDHERLQRSGHIVNIKTFNNLFAIEIDGQLYSRAGAMWMIALIQANADVLWPEPIEEEENVEA